MTIAVCIALVLTIVAAKLIGCILPMLAETLKIDPAMVTSPLITTLVDIVCLAIYFGLASAFLGG